MGNLTIMGSSATNTSMPAQDCIQTSHLVPGALPPTVIHLGGEEITLLPQRAAFWARTQTLFLSDVHLGKAQTLAAIGIGLPCEAMLQAQLQALESLIQHVHARRVFIIGDLIHAPVGLTAELIETVAAWRTSCTTELVLIPGNHDRKIERVASSWKIQLTDAVYQEGPFTFAHDPVSAPPSPPTPTSTGGGFQWSGHIHPAAKIRQGKGSLKLPCFHIGRTFAVLPAFSPFTGGVSVRPAPGERLYGIVSDRVIPL